MLNMLNKEQEKYLVFQSLEVTADQQRGREEQQRRREEQQRKWEEQQRRREEQKRVKILAATVTKIRANNETGKQINFAGDLFIETSSAELF